MMIWVLYYVIYIYIYLYIYIYIYYTTLFAHIIVADTDTLSQKCVYLDYGVVKKTKTKH